VAAKRVIAFQIAREMELAHISQRSLRGRMKPVVRQSIGFSTPRIRL